MMLSNWLCSVLQHITITALVSPARTKFIGGCCELLGVREGEGMNKENLDLSQHKLTNTTVDWTHSQEHFPGPNSYFYCARYLGRYLFSKLLHQLN